MNAFILAMADFVCALVIFHRALPTIRYNRGKAKAGEVWTLGMVLAIMGGGNLVESWSLNPVPTNSLIVFAQYLLVFYALLRIKYIAGLGCRNWWNLRDDHH